MRNHLTKCMSNLSSYIKYKTPRAFKDPQGLKNRRLKLKTYFEFNLSITTSTAFCS